jgi:hypothetical protein
MDGWMDGRLDVRSVCVQSALVDADDVVVARRAVLVIYRKSLPAADSSETFSFGTPEVNDDVHERKN